MNYENPNNETEILSADERKLREMCFALKKVEAPGDFHFKLKARLARSKKSDFAPRRFGFAPRYALPALALFLVFGWLAYSGGFFASNNNPEVAGKPAETLPPNPVPQETAVAEGFSPPPAPPVPSPTAAVLTANQTLPKSDARETAPRRVRTVGFEEKRAPRNGVSSNSAVQALKSAPVLAPINSASQPLAPDAGNDEKTGRLSVREALSKMGIGVDLENGKWTVKAVRAGSAGEMSGVKVNDVIEAIDDQPLAAGTVFDEAVEGKTMTVTRNGEKARVMLRAKP